MRVATPPDEVGDGDPLGSHGTLGKETEESRNLFGGTRADIGAVENHAPVVRSQQACERAQQRRFAAAVGADDGRDAPCGYLESEGVDHGAVAVREGEILGRERVGVGHSAPPARFVRISR